MFAHKDKDFKPNVYSGWNDALLDNIAQFTAAHPDATVMTFSAYELFSKVFAKPADYGFDEKTAHSEGGSIFFDHLHINSRMHGVVADAIVDFLASQEPAADIDDSAPACPSSV